MLSSITEFQKTIWNQWNVRIVILFSLFLQIFLIVSAPSRKRTRSFFVSFVWLAYLLADWAAGYCIGLISNNQEQKSTLSQNDYLMAFWGPFLLLHLGGPDTISAFALEDNELWRRHLLALIFQLVTAAYVFLLTLPRNTLWLPTILMFVAGLIKYAERTHSLYVAAIDNFRKSLLPDPDAGPNYAKLMEEHSSRHDAGLPAKIIVIPELRQGSPEVAQKGNNDQGSHEVAQNVNNDQGSHEVAQKGNNDQESHEVAQNVNNDQGSHEVVQKGNNEDYLELVQKAFFFFGKFQGLIVDMIYSFKDRLDSQQYLENKSAEEAFKLIEIELNFMYEVFYTKTWVVRKYWFWFWGKFISIISIMSTIILFIKEERHCNCFDKLDVRVTYALLSGALVLDVICLLLRFFNDYTATLSDESLRYSYAAPFYQKFQIKLFKYLNKRCLVCYLMLRKPTWSKIDEGPYKGCEKLSTNVFFRRWCGSISGYNLLKCCLDESVPRVVPNNLHGSFTFGKVIQRVRFRIVVPVQNFPYHGVKCFGIKDFLDQWRNQSTNPFLKELWEFVFAQLKEKSGEAKDIEAIRSICSARGERVIQKNSKPNVDPNKVAELLESLKSDPNQVAALLKSLMPNVDPNDVAALLESLKPKVDTKEIAALSESLKPYVDPAKVKAKLVRMKPCMDVNEATSRLESLKPNVDPNNVVALLESLKPYVDPNEVRAKLASLKPCEDRNEATSQLESLKPYVDSTKLVTALLKSLKPHVDPNEVEAKLKSLKPYAVPEEATSQLESSMSNEDTSQSESSMSNEDTSQFESLMSNRNSTKLVVALLESLKPSVHSINLVAVLLESLKPYVDSINLVAALIESLKPYVNPNKVAAKSKRLKSLVNPNEATSRLESLKSDVDSIIVVATLESLKSYVDPDEVSFDESLLLWHIATSLCYTKSTTEEGHISGEGHIKREISMLLSDYMLYLLIMQPNMMSAIAGMGQKRFQDTCEEAKKFFKKRISAQWDRKALLKEACNVVINVPTKQKPIDVKGDRSKSLLFDACRLAKILDKLPNEDKKWEIVACVWVELLSYAACHCRPTGHIQLMSKGGELISFVWLLMVQLGLGTQFQIKAGDARAKLIVGKLLHQSTKQAHNIEN